MHLAHAQPRLHGRGHDFGHIKVQGKSEVRLAVRPASERLRHGHQPGPVIDDKGKPLALLTKIGAVAGVHQAASLDDGHPVT